MRKISVHIVVVLLSLLLTSTVYAFNDVKSEMLLAESVLFLKKEGIVVGYSDGSFGYAKPINRAELLKIVVEARYAGQSTAFLDALGKKSCFSDVKAGQWYTKYICYAQDAGWVQGYSDGTFKPGQNINFVEAMKIVLQVFNTQYAATDPWYKGLTEKGAEANLIPLTIKEFGQTLTRAEMADIVARKMHFDGGMLSDFLGPEKLDVHVTYETISAGVAMDLLLQACPQAEKCIEVLCQIEGDCVLQ